MKANFIAKLALIGLAATSCGKLTVQVKKDAKNSSLQGSTANSTTAGKDSFSLANPQDFLKHIDDLRTTAAEIIVKQLASSDYVGKFRAGVRNYRKFLISHARKQVTLGDSFYSDPSKECREGGLSLNIDNDNEVLGLILETAIIAKIGETNVGKLNAGLSTEMQALSQFITMELGLDIQGTSSVSKVNDMDVTSGEVTLKLKPIDGESIDDATKAADAKQVITLKFERRLGSDMIGTFHADMSMPDMDNTVVAANFDISRTKDTDHHTHVATVTMGVKGQAPGYARQITVSDVPGNSKQFNFTDVLNVGSANESINKTLVDLDKGTQCKVKAGSPDGGSKNPGDGKNSGDGKIKDPTPTPTPTPTSTPSATPTPTPSPGGKNPGNPSQTPTQNPSQTVIK